MSEDGFIEELVGNDIEHSFDCVVVVCCAVGYCAGNGGSGIFETICRQEFGDCVGVVDVIFIGRFWWCKCGGDGAKLFCSSKRKFQVCGCAGSSEDTGSGCVVVVVVVVMG